MINEPKKRGLWCGDCDSVGIDRSENNYKFDEDGNLLCLDCFANGVKAKYQEEDGHQQKVPSGVCQQCRQAGLKLTQAGNDKYYCAACRKGNEEATKSGINSCYRYTRNFCPSDCQCAKCQTRKKQLAPIITQDLLMEALNRADFNALNTWENDGFLQRLQEIIGELHQSKEMTPAEIRKAVNQDLRRHSSRRKKYSQGI